MTDGWNESAAGFLATIGDTGDWSRVSVLDAPMRARIEGRGLKRALDVGCGEGRFCRMLKALGVDATGIEPTDMLLAEARKRDPGGAYVHGRAEALPFEDGSFDLVVSYLTLIDIPDFRAAFREMVRVLAPGGSLLIANINSFISAGNPNPLGWVRDANGTPLHFSLDGYLDERGDWVEWLDIRILNWHRPLSAYMSELLSHGMILRHFDEPPADDRDPVRQARHRRAPWFMIMEWEKPRA
jgi:SAM-dependent methyltransferase